MDIMNSETLQLWKNAVKKFLLELEPEQCRPGMVTADNIYNRFGAIVLFKNTVLTENAIEGLKKLKIGKVKVTIPNESLQKMKDTGVFRERFGTSLQLMQSVLAGFDTGKPIDMGKIDQTAAMIMDYEYEPAEVLKGTAFSEALEGAVSLHTLNTALLCKLLAGWLAMDGKTTEELVKTALLHDIGRMKAGSGKSISAGTGILSEDELMKKHPEYGWEAVSRIQGVTNDMCMGVLMHHEREDGSGYPDGLKNVEIHEFAKIIAIADEFEKLTAKSTSGEKGTPFDTLAALSGFRDGRLSLKKLDVFLENAAACFVGERFMLNTAEVCEIVHINPQDITRPIIKLAEAYVDLSQNMHLHLAYVL